ncbi:hypothetical protein GCM10027051_02060 [Niabella terrae]
MSEQLIDKEEISNYHIIPAELDKTEYWNDKLKYYVRLGNAYKGKTTLTFNTTEGERTVYTTVWSLTDNYLELKAGIVIPLNSLTDVHL